ncbi:HPP family protein [Microbulbifer halophilus]|uniref:HPP family protein n=1 Tax=Microbulbifer halophilus TaxID=453963 RepID=A0ABW5E974_9GAMM|nr:HPP family protein [Microbulbifer halophilus]MCW8125043.1 HPP family protein [Microbulbifer halophilus]
MSTLVDKLVYLETTNVYKLFRFPRPLAAALSAGIGAALCIATLSGLDSMDRTGIWLMAPFGATMVILFCLPESPLAQPRNIVLGHCLTALVGVLSAWLFGVHAWSLGLAVGLAVALMQVTGTTHPPAGANPILLMLGGQDWGFLLTPVAAGTVLIVLFGTLYHRALGQKYPSRWL